MTDYINEDVSFRCAKRGQKEFLSQGIRVTEFVAFTKKLSLKITSTFRIAFSRTSNVVGQRATRLFPTPMKMVCLKVQVTSITQDKEGLLVDWDTRWACRIYW